MITPHTEYPNLRLFDHPLIEHKLTRMRSKKTRSLDFRRLLNEVAGLMTFAISHDLPTEDVVVETPLEAMDGKRIAREPTVVPILRAGIGMTDGILSLLPEARVGHIGVYRDEERLVPISYYTKLPTDVSQGPVLLLDPMIATGGSASFALTELHERGCRAVKLVCLVCAPEGIRRLLEDHPEIPVYAAALDRSLNDDGYILPGLGDAGDRLFGTH